MKKLKLFSLLSVFALCLCTLGIGVWAARQASFTSSGSITFNAINVEVEVTGVIKNAGTVTPKGGTAVTTTNYTAINKLTFGANPPADTDLATWQNDVAFDATGTAFTLEITVTNKSSTRDIWVYIHDNAGIVYNLKREITNSDHARKILKGDNFTFNIEISVYSIYENIGTENNQAKYDFTINMYDQDAIVDASTTNLNYVPIDDTTAKVAGLTVTTGTPVIEVEPLIKIEDNVYIVTQLGEDDSAASSLKSSWITPRTYTLPFTLKTLEDTSCLGFSANWSCSRLDQFVYAIVPYTVTTLSYKSGYGLCMGIGEPGNLTWTGQSSYDNRYHMIFVLNKEITKKDSDSGIDGIPESTHYAVIATDETDYQHYFGGCSIHKNIIADWTYYSYI